MSIYLIYIHSMLKTSKLLTMTVPKETYRRIHEEAVRRKATVSGLLRESFEYYIEQAGEVYSVEELDLLLKRDCLPKLLRERLDKILDS